MLDAFDYASAHGEESLQPMRDQLLGALEKEGLVVRKPHPTDRRAKRIELTPAGQLRRDEVLARLGSQSPLTRLTADQQSALVEIVEQPSPA